MDKIMWTSRLSHGDQGLLYPGRVLVVGVDVPLDVAEKWVKQGAADVYTEPPTSLGDARSTTHVDIAWPKDKPRRKR
jgi:hypothetical protein